MSFFYKGDNLYTIVPSDNTNLDGLIVEEPTHKTVSEATKLLIYSQYMTCGIAQWCGFPQKF